MLKRLLFSMYGRSSKRIKQYILGRITRMEKGEYYSETLRQIFSTYHKVDVGMYTHGGVFIPGNMDRYTTVGRYCSIARSVRSFNRNHPMDFKSMHAFFFNSNLGIVSEDKVEYTPLNIGNDVWIGESAIITPNVTEISTGAVVAAGSVVNKNIPPYAVVVGNPGRVVRYRFTKEVIEKLLESKWWESSIKELKQDLEEMTRPVG